MKEPKKIDLGMTGYEDFLSLEKTVIYINHIFLDLNGIISSLFFIGSITVISKKTFNPS